MPYLINHENDTDHVEMQMSNEKQNTNDRIGLLKNIENNIFSNKV